MRHLIIGNLITIFILVYNFSFAQVFENEINCSYFQDDLHLMNGLKNYCNTKIKFSRKGFILVSIFQNNGILEYCMGYSELIFQDIMLSKFDSFKFGNHFVLVFSGFEHPALLSVYEKKKKLFPQDLVHRESELTEIRFKYIYKFFQKKQMPFKVEKYKLEGFPAPFVVYYPFVEFENNFANPFNK